MLTRPRLKANASISMNPRLTFFFIFLLLFRCSCGRSQHDSSAPQSENHKEIIRFVNRGDTLEGDLLTPVPISQKKVPLVVFVHGSGHATRQDYGSFAERLTKEGYATFRYDKRGVAKSGGTFQELGPHNGDERVLLLASDAAAAIQTLLTKGWFDEKRVIVMGGSQAGWIIPVVASMHDVSAIVCISGPTVSVGEEIYYSDFAEHGTSTQAEADKLLGAFKGTRGFDNISYISRLRKPSLWIFGGKDISIPVIECIRRLDSVKIVNNLPVEMKLYPEGDHGLYDTVTKTPIDVASYVIAWLDKR